MGATAERSFSIPRRLVKKSGSRSYKRSSAPWLTGQVPWRAKTVFELLGSIEIAVGSDPRVGQMRVFPDYILHPALGRNEAEDSPAPVLRPGTGHPIHRRGVSGCRRGGGAGAVAIRMA